jgi:hypothetical protein
MISAYPFHETASVHAAQFFPPPLPTSGSRLPAPYFDRLHPWCIIRLLPQIQRTVIARFRKRNDAEAHLKILQQMNPDAEYVIIFDPPDRL